MLTRISRQHPNPLARTGLGAEDLPALAAAAIAGVALVGWLARLPVLTYVVAGSPVMKANAALAILLLSGACILGRHGGPGVNKARMASLALVGLTLAVACATGFEYTSGQSLGIDELIAPDRSGSVGMPGRMAVNTVGSLILLGAAILVLDWAPRRVRPSEWLGASVAVVALLAVIGDIFGVEQVVGVADYAHMAANTTVAFLLLSTAVVAARREHVIFRALRGPDASAVFLRRLVPVAIVLPFALGLLVMVGVRKGAFGYIFGLSLATFLEMALGLVAIVATATYVRRAEMERVTHREEGVFKMLVETANEGVWTTDEQGRIVFMNQRMLEMLGYESEELIGKPALDLAPMEIRGSLGARMQARLRGERETYEFAFVRKDGSPVWGHVAASANFDSKGQPIGSLAMVTDITERRTADQQLRRSENRFRTLFERAGVGIALTDQSGRLVSCNPALHAMLGYAEGELTGKSFEAITRPEDRAGFAPLADMAGGQREDKAIRTRCRRKDGEDVEVQVVLTRLDDEAGGWLAVIQNLTDVVRAEQATRESEQKSHFLSMMSHELRTPLNAILGFAQLLQPELLTDKQRRYVENIRTSGEHLLVIVTDVLDLSKVTTGTLTADTDSLEVSDLVTGCMAEVGAIAASKAIALRAELAPSLVIRGDGARVRQALLNLLSNAVRFTETGSVTVSADRDGEFIAISVVDTGIGIPHDRLEDVFREFVQVEDETTRSAGGTGLGLALTRRLVELMGGRIDGESQVGVGSRFTIRLPAA